MSTLRGRCPGESPPPPKPPKLCKGGCGQPVRPPNRVWCGVDACKQRWLAWHFWSFAKQWVKRRDRGICAECGLDCAKLESDMWEAWHRDRPKFDRMMRLYPRFVLGRSYSEIDHIVERAAGGKDDPDNLQTLCCECHMSKTVAFNRELNDRRQGSMNAPGC